MRVVCILFCSFCDHDMVTCSVVLVKSWSWSWSWQKSYLHHWKEVRIRRGEILMFPLFVSFSAFVSSTFLSHQSTTLITLNATSERLLGQPAGHILVFWTTINAPPHYTSQVTALRTTLDGFISTDDRYSVVPRRQLFIAKCNDYRTENVSTRHCTEQPSTHEHVQCSQPRARPGHYRQLKEDVTQFRTLCVPFSAVHLYKNYECHQTKLKRFRSPWIIFIPKSHFITAGA